MATKRGKLVSKDYLYADNGSDVLGKISEYDNGEEKWYYSCPITPKNIYIQNEEGPWDTRKEAEAHIRKETEGVEFGRVYRW